MKLDGLVTKQTRERRIESIPTKIRILSVRIDEGRRSFCNLFMLSVLCSIGTPRSLALLKKSRMPQYFCEDQHQRATPENQKAGKAPRVHGVAAPALPKAKMSANASIKFPAFSAALSSWDYHIECVASMFR